MCIRDRSTLESWEHNLDIAVSYNTNHISSYALTIEPKTALEKYVEKGLVKLLDEEIVFKQYKLMLRRLSNENYINYELSSFAKDGYFSKNISADATAALYLSVCA